MFNKLMNLYLDYRRRTDMVEHAHTLEQLVQQWFVYERKLQVTKDDDSAFLEIAKLTIADHASMDRVFRDDAVQHTLTRLKAMLVRVHLVFGWEVVEAWKTDIVLAMTGIYAVDIETATETVKQHPYLILLPAMNRSVTTYITSTKIS